MNHIKSDTELKLAETDGTQGERSGITFLQMVGTVHDAFEEYAMHQLKHVTHLVGENFAAPPKQDFLMIFRGFFSVERRIISRKTENTDAVSISGLAKDEIP